MWCLRWGGKWKCAVFDGVSSSSVRRCQLAIIARKTSICCRLTSRINGVWSSHEGVFRFFRCCSSSKRSCFSFGRQYHYHILSRRVLLIASICSGRTPQSFAVSGQEATDERTSSMMWLASRMPMFCATAKKSSRVKSSVLLLSESW